MDRTLAQKYTFEQRKPYQKVAIAAKTKNYHTRKLCTLCGRFVSNPAEHLSGFHKIKDKTEKSMVLKDINSRSKLLSFRFEIVPYYLQVNGHF